jgi:hypothetical protein
VALVYNGKGQGWAYTPETTTHNTSLETGVTLYKITTYNYLNRYFPKSITYSTSPGTNQDLYGTGRFSNTNFGRIEADPNPIVIDGNTDLSFNKDVQNAYGGSQSTWRYNKQLNNDYAVLNTQNTAKNAVYNKVLAVVNATDQGSYNYLDAKQTIATQKQLLINSGLSDAGAQKVIDGMVGPTGQFRSYYLGERITPYDSSVLPDALSSTVKTRNDLGDKFNKYADNRFGYYLNETKQGQAASKLWDEAVAADNLDIIGRYITKEAFAKDDYIKQITDPTKSAADIKDIRGSESTALSSLVTEYREQVFPDAEKQETLDKVQNKIFGLVKAKTPGATGYEFRDVQQGLSDLISSDKTINKLWTDAKAEVLLGQSTGETSGQWTKLLKSLGVNDSMITNQDSFGTLLSRVATLNTADTGDKKIIADNDALFKTISGLKNNVTFQDLISYTPEINNAFTASVQASEKEQTEQFGRLRQSILQDTIEQLKLAKRQETNLSFFKSSSVGQEISALQKDITGSLLGDLGIGGISPLGSSQKDLNTRLNLGLGDIFGTKNGLIYNWEDWFNNQIEKKYAGKIDIPNDYIPFNLRTASNGFVDDKTIASWKKYDDAYAILKTKPNDLFAKSVVANVPTDYVSVENRKTVNKTWTDYEAQLKAAGYVSPQTLAGWAQYDDAYAKLQKNPDDATARKLYDSRPGDYIVPDQRMDKDVQFAKDFFSTYLKPRFDASQSITEFQDYIDVVKGTQNPFQTQDRLDALKLAAQTSVSKMFADLQKAGDSKFNADYYFDPGTYLKEKGIGDPVNPLIGKEAFNNDQYTKFLNTVAGATLQKTQQQQADKVSADWEAAKIGNSTTDAYGNTINWLQQAYNYGVDLNDKAAFAQLHYQLVGLNAPKLDSDGQIVRNADGTPEIDKFDAAPDVYAPGVAQAYIAQVLTPYLIDKANKIGSVFGQFVKPADYVEEVLKAVNLPENKEQWSKILQSNGLDPNASLTELKNTLVNALSQDSTIDIKQKITDLIKEGKTPTQSELGVEYLQKATPKGTEDEASGIYAVFKNAGYEGSENDFYATFLPDASAEEISTLNAAYSPAGKGPSLLPTISGTGVDQIASMAQLFGDTDVQEVLGTAGIAVPSGKPSLLGGLLTTSEEDIGIGDPFADTSTPFAISSRITGDVDNKTGIGNPFDDVGITDPFAEESDPFSISNPFSTIGSTSSVSKPKINVNVNVSTQGFSSKKNGSFGSLFDSFGGF